MNKKQRCIESIIVDSPSKLKKYLIMLTDINELDKDGNTILHIASYHSSLKCIPLIFGKGASVNKQGQLGYTPLHISVVTENIKLIQMLISEYNANTEICDCNGETPLHKAVRMNNPIIVDYLVENGANMKHVSEKFGQAPLQIACGCEGMSLAAKVLISKLGKDINEQFNEGLNALHMSALTNLSDVATYLLDEQNINPNLCSRNGFRALDLSLISNSKDTAKVLLKSRSIDVNAEDSCGETSIYKAIFYDQFEIIPLLLQKGSLLNHHSKNNGNTPLHFAVLHAKEKAIEIVLTLEKEVCLWETTNSMGLTPLHLAAIQGNINVVQMLWHHHLNIEIKDPNSGYTPLHFAVANGKGEMVQLLLKLASNRDCTDNMNNTPLILSVITKCPTSIIKDLMHDKNGLVFKEKHHKTAFKHAAKMGNIEAIKMFLTFHNLDYYSSKKLKPIKLAALNGHVNAFDLLFEPNSLNELMKWSRSNNLEGLSGYLQQK